MQYPRMHEPILPALLRPLVLDGRSLKWRDGGEEAALAGFDLGPAAWTALPPETCRRLGRLVVHLVERRLRGLSSMARATLLPSPSSVLDLPLERRTTNTLRRVSKLDAIGHRWTLNGYLAIPRFGARAMVDLLAALEADGRMGEGVAFLVAAELDAVFEPGVTLDDVLVAIVRLMPVSETQANEALVGQGLLRQSIDIERLVRSAVRFGRAVPFRVIDLAGSRVVVRLADVTTARNAYRVASRAVDHCGVACTTAVEGLMRGLGHIAADLVFVERVLASVTTFQWLEKRGGWFWFLRRPNPLLGDLRKVLSVVTRVPIIRLAAALRRVRVGPVPPAEVLQRMCAVGVPGGHFADGVVVVDRPLDRRVHLKEGERHLVEVLEAAGGRLSSAEIRRRIQGLGIGWPSLWKLLRTSPIFEQPRPGVFQLMTGSASG